MISNHDRSGWFGASDTHWIMGNWETNSFRRFWLEKLGIIHNSFFTAATLAGTYYEHRILESLGIVQMDRQIKIRRIRLRVNLDGEELSTIHEIKTYSKEPFKVSKAYWQQCQVQMWATGKECQIDAYRLLPEDYQNYFNPIDLKRLSPHPIAYNLEWAEKEYLPRISYLAKVLRDRRFPKVGEFYGTGI